MGFCLLMIRTNTFFRSKSRQVFRHRQALICNRFALCFFLLPFFLSCQSSKPIETEQVSIEQDKVIRRESANKKETPVARRYAKKNSHAKNVVGVSIESKSNPAEDAEDVEVADDQADNKN